MKMQNNHPSTPQLIYSSSGSPSYVSTNASAAGSTSAAPAVPPNTAIKNTPNAGALLEQYTYDDDQTADLLYAIRSWNLEQRPSSSFDYCNDGCSSTIATGSGTGTIVAGMGIGASASGGGGEGYGEHDLDASTIVTGTSTAGGSSVMKTNHNHSTATPKTPSMCNYSSKISALTTMILENGESPPHRHSYVPQVSHRRDNLESSSQSLVNAKSALTSPPAYVSTNDDVNKKTKKTSVAFDITSKQPIHEGLDTNTDTGIDALEILSQTAAELGLKDSELHAVLPTIQKLVKVITQHVPKLEDFVEQVCQTVEEESDKKEIVDVQKKKKKKRNRKSKNMRARKERMDAAIQSLKEQIGDRNETSIVAKYECDSSDGRGRDRGGDSSHGILFEHNEKCQDAESSDASFRIAIKQQMNHLREGSQDDFVQQSAVIDNMDTPRTKTTKHIHEKLEPELLTDAETIEEIQRLVKFEGKYRRLDDVIRLEDSSSSATPKSPDNSTVISDLLNADTTTLRRFVLHFAYLFSVKQDKLIDKMNSLYVFSHEATELIDNVKNVLGLPSSTPIHSVAKKVVEVVNDSRNEKERQNY